MQADNELTQIKLRKYESKLTVSGRAVITFGVWSVIKAAFFFLTQPIDLIKSLGLEKEVTEMAKDMAEANADVTVRFVFNVTIFVMIFLYMFLAVILRLYIGRSAITESRGLKKKSVLYIFLAVLLSISLILSLLSMFNEEPSASSASTEVLDAALTSSLLDLTSLIALVDLIFSAIRVRQLRKRLGIVINGKKQTDLTGLLEESGMEG